MGERVVIIGGGVIGLASAYYAQLRGYHVTLVERHSAQRDGCSYGNAGLVVPSHFVPLAAPGMVALGLRWMWNPESPFYIKPRASWQLLDWAWRFWRSATAAHVQAAAPLLRDLSLASRACYQELQAALPDGFDFREGGLLMLCKTQQSLDEEAHAAAQAQRLGLTAEVFDARKTAEIEPGLSMDVLGSVHFPQDCSLSPQRFMKAFQQRLETAGVQFAWNTEVTGWRLAGARLAAIKTSQGEIAGDAFVLSGGAWSPALVRGLGLRLPMQAGKGYSLTLPQPRQLPKAALICTEARLAVTPMTSALRFGGTMEIAGLDDAINARRVQGIIKAVPRYFPEFSPADFDGARPWCGLRPCTPDGLPYVGRSARFENLFVATGHAMLGMSLGPITGKLIAELLSGEPNSIDVKLLSPERFG
jgi:D-amino-acid dehydrogenase